MSQILVRLAVPADHDAIAALSVAAYRGDGQTGDGHPYEHHLRDVGSRTHSAQVLVAVDEPSGELLGAVTFVLPGSRFAELSGPGEAEFRMLAVAPTAQGRGVGEALVRACLDRAGELGRHAVVICVRDFATSARRLYDRLGFSRAPDLDWEPMPGVKLLGLRRELPRGEADEV